MIDKFEMHLPNYTLVIRGNKGIINDKSLFITEEDKQDILRIIRLWKEVYRNHLINEEKYYIKLYSDNNDILGNYLFDGAFPPNFGNLIDLLGSIYDRR